MPEQTTQPKGQQTMQNKAKPITVQIQLDATHFRAQVAEMAEIARQEFSRQAVGAGMFTRAEVREQESASPQKLDACGSPIQPVEPLTAREKHLIDLARQDAKQELQKFYDQLQRAGKL